MAGKHHQRGSDLTPGLAPAVSSRHVLQPRTRSADWADVQQAILTALMGGPKRLAELAAALGMSSRRVYRPHVIELHQAGAIRRLGVKGSSFWCMRSYRGPVPRIPQPHVVRSARVRRSAVTESAVAAPAARSWWLDVPASAFSGVAAQRAREQGWDA